MNYMMLLGVEAPPMPKTKRARVHDPDLVEAETKAQARRKKILKYLGDDLRSTSEISKALKIALVTVRQDMEVLASAKEVNMRMLGAGLFYWRRCK